MFLRAHQESVNKPINYNSKEDISNINYRLNFAILRVCQNHMYRRNIYR